MIVRFGRKRRRFLFLFCTRISRLRWVGFRGRVGAFRGFDRRLFIIFYFLGDRVAGFEFVGGGYCDM